MDSFMENWLKAKDIKTNMDRIHFPELIYEQLKQNNMVELNFNVTVGRIVKYKLTEDDKAKLAEPIENVFSNISEELPAIVVAVWAEDAVNIKVFTDGMHPDLWVTSISKGKEAGQWDWFPRV